MRSGLQILLENLSRSSAVRKIQLSTILAGSKAAIFNTMTVRHREILSWWRTTDKVQTMKSTDVMILAATRRHTPPAPGACYSANHFIQAR